MRVPLPLRGPASDLCTMDVYLIPGLGADHRLFDRLQLPGHRMVKLDWPEMPPGSTLSDFARALAGQVDATRPHALLGVSMGGMVAQELASITHSQQVIIISSWKGAHEMPPHLKLLRGTHPERVLNKTFMKRSMPIMRWQMGVEKPEEVELLDRFMELHPLEQLRIQIAACLEWQGPQAPVGPLTHIHGDKDHLMPLSSIKDAVTVKGGGHFMVYAQAQEVAHKVMEVLGHPRSVG